MNRPRHKVLPLAALLFCLSGALTAQEKDTLRFVRIRIRGDKGFITIKGASNASGTSGFEWEKEIGLEEAEALLALAEPGAIDKTRYMVRNSDGRHIWEVDEFHGDNEGLTVAEIELEDENEPFGRPDWLGKEVTGDSRYFNSSLKDYPYTKWK